MGIDTEAKRTSFAGKKKKKKFPFITEKKKEEGKGPLCYPLPIKKEDP